MNLSARVMCRDSCRLWCKERETCDFLRNEEHSDRSTQHPRSTPTFPQQPDSDRRDGRQRQTDEDGRTRTDEGRAGAAAPGLKNVESWRHRTRSRGRTALANGIDWRWREKGRKEGKKKSEVDRSISSAKESPVMFSSYVTSIGDEFKISPSV